MSKIREKRGKKEKKSDYGENGEKRRNLRRI
jgi:hypothetical protein